HQPHDSSNDLVWLWIPKADDQAYERRNSTRRHIIHEKRWCESRILITELQRGKSRWFPVKLYFTVVSSINSVMQSYPTRKITYARIKKGSMSGVLVKRTA